MSAALDPTTRLLRACRGEPVDRRVDIYSIGCIAYEMLAGRPVYTGSERCGPCHEEEYNAWSASRHAHAFDTLVEESQDFNPNCVRCHTVGFRRKSGFVNPNATPALKHVGCEACHGPSSRHPDEELTGYGRTTVRMCVTCHTRENSPDYDPATYVPRILHWEQDRQAAR